MNITYFSATISDPACKESSSLSLNSLVSLALHLFRNTGSLFLIFFWGGGVGTCSALVHVGYIFHPFSSNVTDVLINISWLGWPNAHMHQDVRVWSIVCMYREPKYRWYNLYYYTSDSLWKIWLVESIQSIYNSLWSWHDKSKNAISAADIAFIMSSSTSAWLLSPLKCSPQKQNGWTLRFCFWGWIMSNNWGENTK